ncbi:MAG: hypothetical protein Kow0042_14580 [Calditrichia bacterium]
MRGTDINRENGAVLIYVLFLIVFLGTFGVILSRMVASQMTVQSIYTGQQQAFYAAETGIEYAIRMLEADISWRTGAQDVSVGGAKFSVTVDDSSTIPALNDTILITSVGVSGRGVKTLQTYLAPGASIDVLLVVSTIPPNSRDRARKDLIESWGFRVSLINDQANQATIDAAVDTSDVVYISEETWGPYIGNKYTNVPIGVVSEEEYLDDDLKFSSSNGGLYTSTGFEVSDNTHYITAPFSLGFLRILNWYDFLPHLRGSLAPGRQTLGTRPFFWFGDREVVLAIEAGAQLYGGGTAAGRRVRLGWGLFSFSPNFLNSDGKAIMRRSIEWVAGIAGNGGSGSIAVVEWKEE